MSKMGEIHYEIQQMLYDGVTPALIAVRLEVPLSWVISVEEQLFYDDTGYNYTEEEQYQMEH